MARSTQRHTPFVRHPQVPSFIQQFGSGAHPEQPRSLGQFIGPPSGVDPDEPDEPDVPEEVPELPEVPEPPELPAPELEPVPVPQAPPAHVSPSIVQSTHDIPGGPHAV
jgi:hypothetical protein